MNPVFCITDSSALSQMVPRILDLISRGLKGGPVVIELGRGTRSKEQNRKLWPMLSDVANQIEWYGQKLTKEEWKDVFTAGMHQQKCVPGIGGGVVFFGFRTSKMNKKQFSDLIEFIYAFGAERGVEWSEQAIEMYKEAADDSCQDSEQKRQEVA